MPVSTKPTHSTEDVDRRYVFHPFTDPRRHERDGGHMFYAWETSRRAFGEAIATFVADAVGA